MFDRDKFTKTVMALNECLGPDEVAEFLQLRGVTGKRSAAPICPISRYVNAEHPEVFVLTNRLAVSVWDGRSIDSSEARAEIPLAEGPRDFVRHFDQGAYPGLVDRA